MVENCGQGKIAINEALRHCVLQTTTLNLPKKNQSKRDQTVLSFFAAVLKYIVLFAPPLKMIISNYNLTARGNSMAKLNININTLQSYFEKNVKLLEYVVFNSTPYRFSLVWLLML